MNHNRKRRFAIVKSARRRIRSLERLEDRRYLAFSVIASEVSQSPPVSLVGLAAEWKYLDDGSDQGSEWRSLNFDDSTWSSGIAELGYGDGDEATVIGFGGDPDAKVTTTYFRHEFIVSDPTEFDILDLAAIRDDGIAVYLNGVQLLRDNLGVAAESSAFADAVVSGSSESTPVTVSRAMDTLPPGLLIGGTNVLAAEVHQADLGSSDVSFATSLTGQSNKYQLTVEFNGDIDPATLQAEDLIVDGGQSATDVAMLSNTLAAFKLPSLSAGQHSFEIAAGSIESTQQEGVTGATVPFEVGAVPQYIVNQTPRLQPGNAPLSGYAGSELDQVDILWQTISAGDGTQDNFSVQYRLAGTADSWVNSPNISQTVTGVSSRIVHETPIVGLDWDTEYEYRVRHLRTGMVVDTYQHTFHTRLQAGDATSFSFAAYGDSAVGDASGFREVQARVNLIDPAFTVLLGDNVYSSGTHNESDLRFDPTVNPEATEWIAGHIDYLGLGNHDTRTSSGRPAEENFSVPIPVAGVNAPAAPPQSERPEHNFSWDYGNVHFVTFDTNSLDDASRLDGLLDWVVADLRASDATWKIVYGHHPVAGVPDKPENPGDYYYQQVVRQLNDAGVDLFMVRHSHTYAWTYPLTGEVDGVATYADGLYNEFQTNTGIPQLVSGLGGQTPRTGSFNQFPFVAAGYSASTDRAAELGFSKIDVTPDSLTISYIAADDGEVIDGFTITRAADVAPPIQHLVSPDDNSPSDFNLDVNNVLVNTSQDEFQILLSDIGGGVDDSTVISQTVSLIANNTPLVLGQDYTFVYEPTTNLISLVNTSSSFGDGTYLIDFNSGASQVADKAGNVMPPSSMTIVVDTSSTGPKTVLFQQNVAGYSGTIDTFIDEANPDEEHSSDTSLNVDNDNPTNSDLSLQALLRFDDIFGPEPGKIPTNATLLSAYVELEVSDAGDRVEFHRMLKLWSDTDTWNSRVDGIQADDSESIQAVDILSSGFSIGRSTVNVTDSVQAWLDDPSSNLGWALLPVDSNGVDFDSSEGQNPPALIVNYQLLPDPDPPKLIQFAVNSKIADPPNLPKGTQPTSWTNQRSDLQTIDLIFSKPIVTSASDFRLVNLGINADADVDLDVTLQETQIESASNEVTIRFDSNELAEGIYRLEIRETLQDSAGNAFDGNGNGVGGDSLFVVGNSENRFYRLPSDFNSDGGVSVFDFTTFSYWFGEQAGLGLPAPEYADMNLDGGVSVFDFTTFASNFGRGVSYPVSFSMRAIDTVYTLQSSAKQDTNETSLVPQLPQVVWEEESSIREDRSEELAIIPTRRLEEILFTPWEDWLADIEIAIEL